MPQVTSPQRVAWSAGPNEAVVALAVARHHTYFLTSTGAVYEFGVGIVRCQLSWEDTLRLPPPHTLSPRRVKGLDDVVTIATGVCDHGGGGGVGGVVAVRMRRIVVAPPPSSPLPFLTAINCFAQWRAGNPRGVFDAVWEAVFDWRQQQRRPRPRRD